MTLHELAAEHAGVRASLLALSDRKLPSAAVPETWTPRQVVHHVLLADRAIISLLERLFDKITAPVQADMSGPLPIRTGFFGYDREWVKTMAAVKGTEPDPAVSDENLRNIEAEVNSRYDALLLKSATHDLHASVFPHRFLGQLNFYEWLAFGLEHAKLHLQVLQNNLDPR